MGRLLPYFSFYWRRCEHLPVISIGDYQDATSRQRLFSRCCLGAKEAQAGVKELRIANCGFFELFRRNQRLGGEFRIYVWNDWKNLNDWNPRNAVTFGKKWENEGVIDTKSGDTGASYKNVPILITTESGGASEEDIYEG